MPTPRIRAIYRFPVKSMGGERLPEATVSFQGIPGDREVAFVQAENRSIFPWLTGRQLPAMVSYAARVEAGSPPKVLVRTPAGEEFAASDPALLDHLQGALSKPLAYLGNYRGSFDVAPLAIISGATQAALGRPGDDARFRMTLYVDGIDEPFGEDRWVGKTLRVGDSVVIHVTERDRRCAMITLDPAGGPSDPAVLKAAADQNEAFAGVYAVVLTPGTIREGDVIAVA